MALEKLEKNSRTFLFYFKKIKHLLKRKGWERHSKEKEFSISFYTVTYGFDYAAYDLLIKNFKRLGWDLKMSAYISHGKGEGFDYEWLITKIEE